MVDPDAQMRIYAASLLYRACQRALPRRHALTKVWKHTIECEDPRAAPKAESKIDELLKDTEELLLMQEVFQIVRKDARAGFGPSDEMQ